MSKPGVMVLLGVLVLYGTYTLSGSAVGLGLPAVAKGV